MSKVSFPSWFYDPKSGKGQIFQNEDEVPDGWVDDPNECAKAPVVQGQAESHGGRNIREPEARQSEPEAAPAESEGDGEGDEDLDPNAGLAKKYGLTRKAILADFKEHKIDHDPKLGVDALAAIYIDNFEVEPKE